MGSYESWDDLIRSAVIWAGLEDPAGIGDANSGRGRIREEADDDTEQLGALLQALATAYPSGTTFTAADVIISAIEDPDLRAVLDVAACSKRGGPATVGSLGATLREAKDRPVGGLRLQRLKRAWRVQATAKG
jgi:hypothetical protein